MYHIVAYQIIKYKLFVFMIISYLDIGEYGQVRYYVRAVIERQWKSNVVTKKAFTVLSGLDLNFIPEAAVSLLSIVMKHIQSLSWVKASFQWVLMGVTKFFKCDSLVVFVMTNERLCEKLRKVRN